MSGLPSLTLVLALAALGACSRKGISGQETNTGFFAGHELGNGQDQADVRADSPGDRRYEGPRRADRRLTGSPR